MNSIERKEMKQKIERLIDNNNLEEAKALLVQYENSSNQDVAVYLLKTIIYLKENRFDEAIESIQAGLILKPDFYDLLYYLASIYETKQYYEAAIYFYQKSLNICTAPEDIAFISDKLTTLKKRCLKIKANKQLSIIVLAFNQLKYTKLCIDSIYSYCAHLDFELITVNNGSSDGTENYFSSLPNIKKITLNSNLQASAGANAGIKLAEGKYVLYINNDIILTQYAVDNLLLTMQNNSDIGMLVPVCSASSNDQTIEAYYSNMLEMHRFAKAYNHNMSGGALNKHSLLTISASLLDDSNLEERLRLMTYMCIMPNDMIKQLNGFDEVNFPSYFDDDDLSFRIRRAGKKLVLAKNTFVHHFGSITNKEVDGMTNNVMDTYRKKFISIYGVDAWSDTAYDKEIISKFRESCQAVSEQKEHISSKSHHKKKINILGIESFCGATPLQAKSILKGMGTSSICITNYVVDDRYVSDLKTTSDKVICDKITNLKSYFKSISFDYIIVCKPIKDLPVENTDDFINSLKLFLKRNGQLFYK